MRSYAEAVHLLKSNKAVALKTIQKYTRVTDPEILEETYSEYRQYIENVPFVSRIGLETILAELAANEPKARQAKPEDFLDPRFLAELEKERVFRKWWGK